MKMTRLPDRTLVTVREVMDSDRDFRDRVVKAADEDFLGRASWLWLVRPEGWEEELGGLVDEAERTDEEEEEKRTSRAAQHRLEEANAALQKLRAEMVSLQTLNSQLDVELSTARKARREAEDETAKVRSALEEAIAGQDELRVTAAGLAGRIKQLEEEGSAARERVAAAGVERDEAVRRAEVLELALAEAQRQAASFEAEAATLRGSVEDLFIAARDTASAAGISTALPSSPASSPSAQPASAQPASAQPHSAQPLPDLPAERAPGNSLAASPKRIPAPLPPATFEDSPDAARHLVRVPGVALVVDGYNVTLSSWPGADLPMQRRRLVDSLAELAIRAGTEVLVVFDGVDDGNRLQLPASVRGRMRVRFTASEVEADEVIIALVDSMPVHRPVVVATNDRRVRDDAARKGANVITVDQLLAAIGRGSSPTG
jgi:predicted RNA-binding protein with PIN domain